MDISSFTNKYKGYLNSFDSLLYNFDHKRPLYYTHILVSTVQNENFRKMIDGCAFFQSDNGFYLINDKIISNVDWPYPDDSWGSKTNLNTKLKFKFWNKYYYTYTDRLSDYTFLFYSKLGFEIIRNYFYESGNWKDCFNDSVIGAITIYCNDTKACTTILLSTEQLPLNKRAFNIEMQSFDSLKLKNLQSLKTKGITLALIHDFLKKTYYTISNELVIDFKELGDHFGKIEEDANAYFASNSYTAFRNHRDVFYKLLNDSNESVKFENYIKNNYSSFSNEVKDICKYLYPSDYKYMPSSHESLINIRDTRMIFYTNMMLNRFQRSISDQQILDYYNEYDDDYCIELCTKVTNDVMGQKDKLSWLDSEGELCIKYILGLMFLNLDQKKFVDARFELTSAFAIWTYYMLYRQLKKSSDSDILLFKTLICYLLLTNSNTFEKLFDKIKNKEVSFFDQNNRHFTHSWKTAQSEYCVGELICYYSNDFITYEDSLSDEQKSIVGFGCGSNNKDLNYYKDLLNSSVFHGIRNQEILREKYSSLLFDYISTILHKPDYTNKDILDMIS